MYQQSGAPAFQSRSITPSMMVHRRDGKSIKYKVKTDNGETQQSISYHLNAINNPHYGERIFQLLCN